MVQEISMPQNPVVEKVHQRVTTMWPPGSNCFWLSLMAVYQAGWTFMLICYSNLSKLWVLQHFEWMPQMQANRALPNRRLDPFFVITDSFAKINEPLGTFCLWWFLVWKWWSCLSVTNLWEKGWVYSGADFYNIECVNKDILKIN